MGMIPEEREAAWKAHKEKAAQVGECLLGNHYFTEGQSRVDPGDCTKRITTSYCMRLDCEKLMVDGVVIDPPESLIKAREENRLASEYRKKHPLPKISKKEADALRSLPPIIPEESVSNG